jgi:hypothetical protein
MNDRNLTYMREKGQIIHSLTENGESMIEVLDKNGKKN